MEIAIQRCAAKHAASSGYEKLTETAHRARSAVSHAATGTGQQGFQKATDLVQFCREQPLLLTGLGLAIGAVMGAMLPETTAEQRAMGDASARMKDRARDLMSEPVDTLKQAATETPQGDQDQPANSDETAGEEQYHETPGEVPQGPLGNDLAGRSDGEWRPPIS